MNIKRIIIKLFLSLTLLSLMMMRYSAATTETVELPDTGTERAAWQIIEDIPKTNKAITKLQIEKIIN